MIDLARFAELGKKGGSGPDGGLHQRGAARLHQDGKKWWTTPLKACSSVRKNNRIIIATFASNISRVQQIINCAVRFGRKVALSGAVDAELMGIAVELGYLDVPEGRFD